MRFTIIIPIYNIEGYINKCLSSISNQTYSDFEALMVDDGSTDSSLKICHSYLNDKRFKLLKQNHRGVSAARNLGITHARGEHIVFIDGDDYVELCMLHKINEIINKYNCDSIIYNFVVENDISRNSIYSTNNKVCTIDDRLSFFKDVFLPGKICFGAALRVYKKEIIVKNNIQFNENIKFGEDISFNFQYYLYAINYFVINDCLYHYNYQRIESSTHKHHNHGNFNEINLVSKSIFLLIKNYQNEKLFSNFYIFNYLLFKNEILKVKDQRDYYNIKKRIKQEIEDKNFFKKNLKAYIKHSNEGLCDKQYALLFKYINNNLFACLYVHLRMLKNRLFQIHNK